MVPGTFIRAALFSAALFASSLAAMAAPTIERVGPVLSHPWGMEFLDHDTVLVTERDGRLIRIDLRDGSATQIMGVPPVYARRQGGLLDVATIDGHVYLCYSAVLEGGSATAIDRAVIEGDRLVRRQTIFTGNAASRSGHHFGCRMQVTGGMIYASLGDRGDRANGQDGATNAASIIRINLDGSVPPDNPGPAGLAEGWAAENFTIGHRNPQGMAIHPLTGDVWINEHGPKGGDEINILQAGANYGWPLASFGKEYFGGPVGDGLTSFPGTIDPVWHWTPSIAPSGMAFYDKQMFPELTDGLLVSSLKFRRLYHVQLADNLPTSQSVILDRRIGRIRDVEITPDGAILLLSDEANGGLFRLSR